ncbi:hypothetical protein PBI_DEWDROP_14 [Microbacterium phage Dewdrop]|nr:hypothetical protein PBI_LEAF_14 [Microbacterium phage Leaf]QGZ17383.1 hypothetical protein PBI_DEWDROP_14 [Microbacterium phage Dewdrop]
MTVLSQRIEHAGVRLDLLDVMNPRFTVGGWTALCLECGGWDDDGRRAPWKGSLYLHEKEPQYTGGTAHYNALTEAWQHDMAMHPHWEHTPTWEDILSGAWPVQPRVKHLPSSLGVPFMSPREHVRTFLGEFWDAVLDFPRALGEYLGFGRRS